MRQDRHEADGYRRIEVITWVARRRRWTAEEKATIVAESMRAGVNVSDLVRRYGVNRGLLQTWRRVEMRGAAEYRGLFIPLHVEEASPTAVAGDQPGNPADGVSQVSREAPAPGTIEIESAGLRVCFSGQVDAGALRLVLGHIGRRT